MAEEQRDKILMDFQAITDFENLEECIHILEQHDWDLEKAVASCEMFQSPNSMSSNGPISNQIAAGITPVTVTSMNPPTHMDDIAQLITFHVSYKDASFEYILPDTETVYRLKILIAVDTQVPVYDQKIIGWPVESVSDSTHLKEIPLKTDTYLNVCSETECSGSADSIATSMEGSMPFNRSITQMLGEEFTLNIKSQESGERFQLKLSGDTTVKELKTQVEGLTGIQIPDQVWLGWPEAGDEASTLASCCSTKVHSSTVSRRGAGQSAHRETDVVVVSDGEDDDVVQLDDGEAEDFSFVDQVRRANKQLMPDNIDHESDALQIFSSEFASRYGPCHPQFYLGSFDEALAHALQCRAQERRLLAVYLHNDKSILTNVFCSQTLCAPSIVDYLTENFIVWAWDVTLPGNRTKLLDMCREKFGGAGADVVDHFRDDDFPLLLIITRPKSAAYEVLNAIQGTVGTDDLIGQLIQANDVFNEQMKIEIQEEEERDRRELLKQEQDDAYQQSLAADRAKLDARKAEEEEQRRKEVAERMKLQQETERKMLEERKREDLKRVITESLPPEPPETSEKPVVTIRFRLPAGDSLTRRFLREDPVQVILDFVTSKGFHLDDYKVLLSFPKRDLTATDPQQTLMSLKFSPQEMLILEKR